MIEKDFEKYKINGYILQLRIVKTEKQKYINKDGGESRDTRK